jgi:hypothetical protein
MLVLAPAVTCASIAVFSVNFTGPLFTRMLNLLTLKNYVSLGEKYCTKVDYKSEDSAIIAFCSKNSGSNYLLIK